MSIKKLLSTALTFLGITLSCAAQDDVKTLQPTDFAEALKTDSTAVLLDVRTEKEFNEGHLQNAALIDFLQTESFTTYINSLDKQKTYYVYCRSGRRSHNAALKMQSLGLTVVDMKGGYIAWTAANLPTVK